MVNCTLETIHRRIQADDQEEYFSLQADGYFVGYDLNRTFQIQEILASGIF